MLNQFATGGLLMLVLAIETSGSCGQVALADGARLLAEADLGAQRRHTQMLVPTIRDLLGEVGRAPGDIALVALSIGPGSYTGLRVGLTCAKTLAYAVRADVIAVNTLAAIAENAPAGAGRVSAISDAQRRELYRCEFVREGPGEPLQEVVAAGIVSVEHWAARLQPGTTVLGPALRRYREVVPAHCDVAPQQSWDPRAAVIARLGWERFSAGWRDDYLRLKPLYFRKSAAEEKWEARQARETP